MKLHFECIQYSLSFWHDCLLRVDCQGRLSTHLGPLVGGSWRQQLDQVKLQNSTLGTRRSTFCSELRSEAQSMLYRSSQDTLWERTERHNRTRAKITQSRKRRSVESKALQSSRLGVAVEGRGVLIIPIPREATSVATMMGLLPVLNSFRTQSRSFCCLSPWMAADN